MRGIGVAESDRTSTSSRSARRSSFCRTPKRCSSSTTTSPSSLGDHVAGEDPVRADEHVDLSLGELLQHRLDLGGPAEARDHLDPDREVAVALAEGVPVLLREDRRRAEHEHLPAVDGDRERRADGDLRLSEADVAADEPVHRLRRLEILLDRLDRTLLVVRLAVGERRLEPLEPVALDLERRALGALALRVELQQLAGELLHRGPGARLEVLPCLAAELRERRARSRRRRCTATASRPARAARRAGPRRGTRDGGSRA